MLLKKPLSTNIDDEYTMGMREGGSALLIFALSVSDLNLSWTTRITSLISVAVQCKCRLCSQLVGEWLGEGEEPKIPANKGSR
jgi:hypothetical protein